MRHPHQGSNVRSGEASQLGKSSFSQYHQKRIAFVLDYGERPTVLRGTAGCEQDDLLGCVLRIRLDVGATAGETDLLISEREWNGRIVPDADYGCHYCFIPIAST